MYGFVLRVLTVECKWNFKIETTAKTDMEGSKKWLQDLGSPSYSQQKKSRWQYNAFEIVLCLLFEYFLECLKKSPFYLQVHCNKQWFRSQRGWSEVKIYAMYLVPLSDMLNGINETQKMKTKCFCYFKQQSFIFPRYFVYVNDESFNVVLSGQIQGVST